MDIDVIIVGAGMTEVKTGHDLKKKGISSIILEYSDYVGGRIKNIDF